MRKWPAEIQTEVDRITITMAVKYIECLLCARPSHAGFFSSFVLLRSMAPQTADDKTMRFGKST